MAWQRLALKNSIGNARRYIGYILSSSLAVMVFFMFASFVNNPHVTSGYMTKNAKTLLDGCRYIIAVFSVFFVFFFHAGLIRLRNREFGLFIVLGMTPRQVGRLILYESVLIGAVAVGVGTALGILFSKLFLMAMGALLQLPDVIPFLIPKAAILYTLVFFGVVFILDACWVAFRVRVRSPRMLILGNRVHQKQPKIRWVFAVIGMICLGIGYDLAITKSREFTSNVIPILVLTCLGTYLLYTQVLVWILTRMRRKAKNGQMTILLSRMAYRMKDYARMLTVVTLLTAMVLTGMGAVFSVKHIMSDNAIRINPFTVQVTSQESAPTALKSDQVTKEFQAEQIPIQKQVQIDALSGTLSGSYLSILQKQYSQTPPVVTVLSYSHYEYMRKTLAQAYPSISTYLQPDAQLKEGEAHFYLAYPDDMGGDIYQKPDVQLQVGTSTWKLKLDGEKKTRVLNQSLAGMPEYVLVVRDDLYEEAKTIANLYQKWTVTGWISQDWKQSKPLVDSLSKLLPTNQHGLLTNTVTSYGDSQQMLSLMMFAGCFVSLLFIVASGTTIYFRLFSQQEEDARQFRSLFRIGLRSQEVGRILTVEFALLFFLPFSFALVHSMIAMIDLQHVLTVEGSVWSPFALVAGSCFVCYVVYCVVSRIRYARVISSSTK